MNWIRGIATLLLATIALAGCGEPDPEPVTLLPPETFTWTGGQPVSFSPPPADWERSRYQNGGTEGVGFVLAGGKGQIVFVAERFFLGKRDRCTSILTLLEGLADYDQRTFAVDLNKARRFVDGSPNTQDARMTPVINESLSRALMSFRTGDLAMTREWLLQALREAGAIRYTLAETVDRVIFTAKDNSVFPKLRVDPPVEGVLAGQPAVTVNFTFDSWSVPMIGRRVYTVRNNRMFEIGFQGLAENLPMFEKILGTITFPPGPCEH